MQTCPHDMLRQLGKGRCEACNPSTIHADGWQNLVTGLGTPLDKRTGGGVNLSVVGQIEARDLWRGNDLVKRIVESVADDSLREEITIKMDDALVAEQILDFFESLPGPVHVGQGGYAVLRKARQFERCYGGAAIFPVINDAAGDLTQPLDENNIPHIKRLRLYEPRQLLPLRYYTDINHDKYGEPEIYQVLPLGAHVPTPMAEIHESRLIIYPGVRNTAEFLTGVPIGWGDSVLTPILQVLNDFELTFGSAAHLLQDFAQAILKLKGLAEIVGADGSGEATKRLELMNWARSSLRALVMDSEDSFERVTTNLAGVPDMMDRFMFRLSAAARMPATKLLGMSPSGLSSNNDSGTRDWYDEVGADQQHQKPMIERLLKLIFLSHEGPTKGKEPDTWCADFPPLWQPSEVERADARNKQANTDKIYIDSQVLSPEEVALARFGGDSYSYETTIDLDQREALQAAAPAPVTETVPNAPGTGGPGTPYNATGPADVNAGAVEHQPAANPTPNAVPPMPAETQTSRQARKPAGV